MLRRVEGLREATVAQRSAIGSIMLARDCESVTPRQYWLWVTGPDYYLDDDGEDRQDLEPLFTPSDVPRLLAEDAAWRQDDAEGAWWTCHPDTRRGDLVFLWRTAPRKDIGYLIRAQSHAYEIADDACAADCGWDWGCDYLVLYKFEDPLTISELREDPVLACWAPLRMKFRRRVFSVSPRYWLLLCEAMMRKESGFRDFVRACARRGLEIARSS